jgi:energy-coupling factor transporter ATP-binding protein EcfA2
MLKRIRIKNLRSIREQEIEVAPITVLYGPNGSGKSTLLHALAILRNVVVNPAQPLDGFFNLSFANFGGFEQVVYDHNPEEQIELEIQSIQDSIDITYKVVLGKAGGGFSIRVGEPVNAASAIETTFPYLGSIHRSIRADYEGVPSTIDWNGVLAQPVGTPETPEAAEKARKLAALLNAPVEELRRTDLIHIKRGFSTPHYGVVPLTPMLYTEGEIATLLANDPYLESRVSHSLEQIFGRDLRVRVTPGTALFLLRTTDKTTGLSTELVNEGFGVNQVVYLLTKCLRRDVSVVCIEEPEIHLHPKALANLVYELVKLVKEEKKTLILSTHSEPLVISLLGAVAKKQIKPDEIACYLCTKTKKGSTFERQRVQPDGRVEGGLASFMEAELEELKAILALSKKE